jgi:hypothetical protein
MNNRHFDVDAFLRDEAEQERRNIEAVQQAMREQRAFRPDWWKIGAFVGYVLFWGAVTFVIVAGLMAL